MKNILTLLFFSFLFSSYSHLLQAQDIITSATICEGENYTWLADGMIYTAEGQYIISGSGGNANQVLNLTVQPQGVDIVTNATICSTDSYTWAATGQTYNVPGTYTISGTGCAGDQVLNLTVESCLIDVWLEKAISPIGAQVGDTVVFTLTVGNNGPAIATGVQVLDKLPSGYTYINNFATQGVFDISSGIWQLGTLPVNAHSLSIVVVVNATGEYCNYAEIIGHNEQDIDSIPNDGCTEPDNPNDDDDCDIACAFPSNFGLSLGNLVWNDFDNDGFVDFNEPGIGGVRVDLYAADAAGNPTGPFLQTDFTDISGEYNFSGLTSGEYVVSIPTSNFSAGNALDGYIESTGRVPTDPDDDIDNVDDGFDSEFALGLISQAITLTLGNEPISEDGDTNSNNTVDFGLTPNGSIGNKVWVDSDGDGAQDADESGLPGVFVELFDISVSNTASIANQVTDVNGCYLFIGLDAGDYYVRFTYPGNYTSTVPNATNDAQDSDVDGTNGPNTTRIISLTQGQNDMTVDAGVYGGAKIGNFTWNDTDGSIPNLQDSGDMPLQGVAVNLYCNDPISGPYLVGAQLTDVKGEYCFNNVNPSGPGMTYFLEFIPPSGYTLVAPDVGTDDLIDCDVNQVTATTPPFIVNPGDINLSFDAGYVCVLSPLVVVQEPQSLVIQEHSMNFENVIADWLANQGGAEILITCASVTWTHNYDYDYSVGNHWVTFFATSDSGVSTEIFGLLSITDCTGTNPNPPITIAEPGALIINIVDSDLETSIGVWLANQGGATVMHNCGEVVWTHDFTNDYSIGNQWVTFTATTDQGASIDLYGLLSITPCDGPNTNPPVILTDPEALIINIADSDLETSIGLWLANQGGAEVMHNCGEVVWTHNFANDYSVGNQWITFTATTDQGNVVELYGLLSITPCDGPNLNPPVILIDPEALVINIADASLESSIGAWLADHGGAEVQHNCGDVIWSNSFFEDYSVGNQWITFTATTDQGNAVDLYGLLSITPCDGPSLNPPSITHEASSILVEENDPDMESIINIWLINHGGAEAEHLCGDVTWSHDFDFDYSPGNHWVRFVATSDQGVMSEPAVGLLSIQVASSVEEDKLVDVLTVYPNPVENTLTIEGLSHNQRIKIIAQNGVTCLAQVTTAEKRVISVGALVPGLYLLEVINKSGDRRIEKFVKL